MHIVVITKDEWEAERLQTVLSEHTLEFVDSFDEVHHPESVECLCVAVKMPVGRPEFERFPRLRGVVTRSTGHDHVDGEEAARRGVSVSNVPGYGEHTIAEYAFALLLALSRRITETEQRIRIDGLFSAVDLEGFDLHGKKMGVIGTGHTGEHAIRIARGFGMEVIVHDRYERKALERELGCMYVTLPDILSQSDILSFHVPYTTQTHHLLNTTNMHLCKRGIYLINTARGGLIETRAIVHMLEHGILAGAGLDVVEAEEEMADRGAVLTEETPDPATIYTLLANQYLIDHPRVLIMPHNAYNTREARERIILTTVKNIRALSEGAPIHLV